MDVFIAIMHYISYNIKNITNVMRKQHFVLKIFQVVMNMKEILLVKSVEKVLDLFMMVLFFILSSWYKYKNCYEYNNKPNSCDKCKSNY